MRDLRDHERGTEVEEYKTGKARWDVCTGEPFLGIKYPLGALVFYRAKTRQPRRLGSWMAGPELSPSLGGGEKFLHVKPSLQPPVLGLRVSETRVLRKS